jgi:beta-mannosidase
MRFRRDDGAIDLGGEWWFAVSEGPVDVGDGSAAAFERAGLTVRPATVPGNVELDLLAQGLIDEPFRGLNVVGLRWLEGRHVYYGRSFTIERPPAAGEEPVIVFEGIDCDAAVHLNGVLVHESRNMLVEQHVPVGAVLRRDAENALCVEIRPILARARSPELAYPPGLVAEDSGFEGLYVRKAPHMFGWDIMPRALSAGIWRPVTLRFLPRERLDWTWIETESIAADGEARLALHFRGRADGPPSAYEIHAVGTCGESVFDVRRPLLFDAGILTFRVTGARLWWPKGRGDPDLYDVRVSLLRDGEPIDALAFRHGIRTVALERTSVTTESGDGEFRFIVNGEPLFVLGTNWVPLDAYHARDAERMRAVLDAVDEIGCNMIRCWGGNVYESDAFFDGCDERGILVWQDFAMACAIYPRDASFQEELRREVAAVVRRLRQHPSLALWAGDNECDQKHVRTGSGRDPAHNILTRSVIPAVLRDEDPSRPYLPSSPYMDAEAVAAGERFLPEDHLWGPRDDYKGAYYQDALCHFASEIGYLGAPAVESIGRFLTKDHLWPYADDPEWLLHATSPFPGVDVHDYRVELLAKQIRTLFGSVPDTLDSFVLASQASQAEALKFFIELFRAGKWRRTGIIWWNIADGWPQFSDAVVDYYGVRKLAFEVVRRSQLPVCVVVREPRDGQHEVVICNDRRLPVTVTYEIREIGRDGSVLAGDVVAGGDAVTHAGFVAQDGGRQRCLDLTWTTDGETHRSHYLAGPGPFPLEVYLEWIGGVGLRAARKPEAAP